MKKGAFFTGRHNHSLMPEECEAKPSPHRPVLVLSPKNYGVKIGKKAKLKKLAPLDDENRLW